MRVRASNLPSPETLGPEIEEGAVNRRPLQALFLLPRGGTRPVTVRCAISNPSYVLNQRVGLLRKSKAVGRGHQTPDRPRFDDKKTRRLFVPSHRTSRLLTPPRSQSIRKRRHGGGIVFQKLSGAKNQRPLEMAPSVARPRSSRVVSGGLTRRQAGICSARMPVLNSLIPPKMSSWAGTS